MGSSPEPGAVWRPAAPAAAEAVERLIERYPGLPPEYVAFIRAEDGSEGALGIEPCWIQLWPAADVASLNEGYDVPALLPGFLGFGSSGGGELFAFNQRATPWRVCMVPFVPMDENEAVEIAPSFAALARQFGIGAPAG